MGRVSRASTAAATAATAVAMLVMLAGSASALGRVDSVASLLGGIALSALFIWCLMAGLSHVPLMVLVPLFDRTSRVVSCAVFLAVGFGIGAGLLGLMLAFAARGEPVQMATEPVRRLVLGLALAGLVGAGSALAAWLSARKTARGG